MVNGGGDFFMLVLFRILSLNDGSFFLQHLNLDFLHFLHLHLQQNCKMPMVKRTARIPKPTSTPTACEFAALPLFPIVDEQG